MDPEVTPLTLKTVLHDVTFVSREANKAIGEAGDDLDTIRRTAYQALGELIQYCRELRDVYGLGELDATRPADPYIENGFQSRDEYLRDLAEGSDDPQAVYALADLLGPEEDFDGLICALEDEGLL